MLFEIIMFPFWMLVDVLVGLVPSLSYSVNISPESMAVFLENLAYALNFFGANFFCMLVGNIVFWLTIQLTWAVIEWIYIKLPGVN